MDDYGFEIIKTLITDIDPDAECKRIYEPYKRGKKR